MAGMRPEDVYELTEVADPRLSPDGSTVAFVVWKVDRDANDYRSAIWAVPLDGSAPPRRVTAGEKQDADPRWSPDGRFLAFTSDRGGKRTKKQLYVMPVGEPGWVQELVKVTKGPAGKLIQENLGGVRFVPLIGEEGWKGA